MDHDKLKLRVREHMAPTVASFEKIVRDSGLLAPQVLQDFLSIAAKSEINAEVLAKTVVERGWLTHFQVRRLWNDRFQDLLVGQYVLVDRLGSNAFGNLYKAWHRRMQRMAAVRVIPKSLLADPKQMQLFVEGIKKASCISHNHIVMAYDAGQAGENQFFATEFVEGLTLAQLVRVGRPLPLAVACNYMRMAAFGLAHAHEQGLIHGKLQPSSFLIGKDDQLKVLDLGLTQFQDDVLHDKGSGLTTLDFQAPELNHGGSATATSDVYSLGCILYFLVTGSIPYPATDAKEKVKQHALQVLPDPRKANPKLPPEIVSILHRAMAKRPESRTRTMMEFAAQIRSWAPGGGFSSPRVVRVQPGMLQESQTKTADVVAVPTPVQEVVAAQPIQQPVEDFVFDPNQPSQPDIIGIPVAEPQGNPMTAWIIFGLGLVFVGIVGLWVYNAFFGIPSDSSLSKEVVNAYKMKFVLVPAGEFEMGSLDTEINHQSDESPRHTVRFQHAFYMMTHEVNQSQYLSIIGKRPSASKQYRNSEMMPVEMVSYEDADDFCQELNQKGMQGIPRGFRYRLPTEAEWEYACRANSETAFSTGNSLDPGDAAIEGSMIEDRALKFPRPGMSGKPNAFGLFDMHGNVWEWTLDWYAPYSSDQTIDPRGPETGRKKVIRGGGWDTGMFDCRSAKRRAENTLTKSPSIGFRVVVARETEKDR
jgi:eukaryotic-like serine/threonine-protein kinase